MAQKPVDNITQIIGNTPVVKLRNVVDEDAAFIIWTTTPWTIPSNLAFTKAWIGSGEQFA